ncbi:endo-1,4-beta-xylanase [Tellurirhabdus bombi]|uniref:endo-1,4-beta-xylanase n=1 Tax=Tellurirhabdus bombi TaxID=2907205 RepID=UPI001F209AF6|nr:endo-1,4-beta-xylanase [Tellurirhabdus bombi]
MQQKRKFIQAAACLVVWLVLAVPAMAQQWTTKKANKWYKKQAWLVGANYTPANAINQLEMWQAESFDPQTIEKELGWAKGLGMNTMRIFLHDLAWKQDPEGFKKRLDQFLGICQKQGIRPMLVLFDSCWDPKPKIGKQREPQPGRHNSGWVQSPGAEILADHSQWNYLRDYVKDVVSSFRNDKRILAWDIVNEPDNDNANSYGKNGELKTELPNKGELGAQLVKEAFGWAREAKPSQPITSAPWYGDWKSVDQMNEMNRFLFTNSDIITFHNYGPIEDFKTRMGQLTTFDRPIICTEYMARPTGSTFQAVLPAAKSAKVGMMNWGFVAGKTNTIYPWDSWQKTYTAEPPLWFHDIFREDGQPYKPEEVSTIRQLTGVK